MRPLTFVSTLRPSFGTLEELDKYRFTPPNSTELPSALSPLGSQKVLASLSIKPSSFKAGLPSLSII